MEEIHLAIGLYIYGILVSDSMDIESVQVISSYRPKPIWIWLHEYRWELPNSKMGTLQTELKNDTS